MLERISQAVGGERESLLEGLSRASEPRVSLSILQSGTAVLDEMGMGLVLLDPSGEVAASNTIAEELLGRRVLDGTLLTELVERALLPPSGNGPSSELGDQRLIEAQDAHGSRCIIGYRFVRSPRLGTIVTLRDITDLERVRADKRQLERLLQVGKACAMVAHEIGNPLAAIKATIQSIEREATAAGLQDPIAAVVREIDRLDKILGQLLGFVRHRAPRRVKADVGTIVSRAREAAGGRLQPHEFRASLVDLPPISCDPDQIQQVFLNLFLNAADAMPDGGELAVSGEVQGDRVVLRVEDVGPGIPAHLRDKVFESFFTTRPSGTGLGLSVSYRIISDHQGAIAVEDRMTGPGACIRVTLPVSRGGGA